MMEISKSMDLKKLPTENDLKRSISVELDHDEDNISAGAVRKVNIDSIESKVNKEILNGLDSSTDLEEKSLVDCIETEGVAKERDAGTDLDALLYKISSIVDCDSTESIDEPKGKSSEDIEAGEEPTADTINEKTDGNATVDDTDQKVLSTENDQKEEQIDSSVEEADVIKAEENEQKAEKTFENSENNEIITNCENGEAGDQPTENLQTSTDEVFEDALENISSSDEFEAFVDKKSEKSNSKLNKHNNNLEDITSDESDKEREDVIENPKPEISIIDLDSSDDILGDGAGIRQTIELAKDAAKDLDRDNLAKPIENTEDTSIDKEMTVDDPVLSKDLEVKEAELENGIEDELVKDDETMKANSKEDKIETENNLDDSEKRKNGLFKDKEDVVTETAKLNGNSEKESEQDVETSEDQTLNKPVTPKAAYQKEAESDDEVIFFEPIKKSTEKGEEIETETEAANSLPSVEKNSTDKKDDDVVLVSEDEDEEPRAKPIEDKTSKSSENVAITKDSTKDSKSDSDMLTDCSDNACDQFAKVKAQQKRNLSAGDEGNSNSSNLLQPSQKKKDETVTEAKDKTEPEPESEPQAEPTAELDDGDVEIVAEETEVEQNSLWPANKRIRLSTDDKPEASNSSSCIATNTSTNDPEAQTAVAKRSYNSLSSPTSPAEKEQTPNKKPRRDDTDSNSSNDGNLQIDMDIHDQPMHDSEPVATVEPAKAKPAEDDSKALTIELKPTPELKSDVKPVRLDFVRNFRNSFDKMTRLDLEELVLQKVVEAMLVQSDFADLRRQVDKHEATLAIYRRKIAEVTKQFLDLETVHKRVLKDLETKNAHFTAPVRITRAVGLQVGMTLIKKPADDVRHQVVSHTAGSMPASTSTSPLKPGPPPLRTPMRSNMPRQVTGQQLQQQQHQQQLRSALPSNIHPSSSGTPPVRRGCMQKVTPTRPVNNNMPSSQQISPNQQQNLQRLQASPASVSARPGYGGAAAPAGSVFKPSNQGAYAQQKQHQQQLMQQKQLQQQQLQQQQPMPVRIGRSTGKQPANTAGKQRSMPMGGGTVSVPISNDTASGSGYGQPNLAPARPKEKAVIDLTDEDDAAAAAAAAAEARLRQQSGVSVKRSMQSTPSSSGTGGSPRQGGGNVVRVSPMNMPRANAVSRQIVNNSTGQRNSTGSSATGQSRSDKATPSRIRYMQPAPLPLAPTQTYHPEWKLPPSRPVIRITLQDSGIVISWTLEDTSPRFAECISYQIYAYQESINEPSSDSWRHVGDVKAMLLPMAVTLNQFQENQRYFFAVRGIDAHDRYGVFSLPKTW